MSKLHVLIALSLITLALSVPVLKNSCSEITVNSKQLSIPDVLKRHHCVLSDGFASVYDAENRVFLEAEPTVCAGVAALISYGEEQVLLERVCSMLTLVQVKNYCKLYVDGSPSQEVEYLVTYSNSSMFPTAYITALKTLSHLNEQSCNAVCGEMRSEMCATLIQLGKAFLSAYEGLLAINRKPNKPPQRSYDKEVLFNKRHETDGKQQFVPKSFTLTRRDTVVLSSVHTMDQDSEQENIHISNENQEEYSVKHSRHRANDENQLFKPASLNDNDGGHHSTRKLLSTDKFAQTKLNSGLSHFRRTEFSENPPDSKSLDILGEAPEDTEANPNPKIEGIVGERLTHKLATHQPKNPAQIIDGVSENHLRTKPQSYDTKRESFPRSIDPPHLRDNRPESTTDNKPDTAPQLRPGTTPQLKPEIAPQETAPQSIDREPEDISQSVDGKPGSTSQSNDRKPEDISHGKPASAPQSIDRNPEGVFQSIDGKQRSAPQSIDRKPEDIPHSTDRKPGSAPQSIDRKSEDNPHSTDRKPGSAPQSVDTKPEDIPQSVDRKPGSAPQSIDTKPENVPQSADGIKPGSAPQSIDTKPEDIPQSVDRKPGSASQSIDTKPENIPQSVDRKPGSAPQSIDTKPENIPQSVDRKPGSSPQSIDTKPENIPQSVDGKPGSAPQSSDTKPENFPQTVDRKPGSAPQSIDTKPENIPQPVDGKPGSAPQSIDTKPGNIPQSVDGKPGSAPQSIDTKPENIPQSVVGKPGSAPQSIDTKPENIPQSVDRKPGSAPQSIDKKPEDILQVDGKPESAPQSIDTKPENIPQSVDRKPGSAPQSIDTKPENIPQSVDGKPGSAPQSIDRKPEDIPNSTDRKPGSAPQLIDSKPNNPSQSMNDKPDNSPQSLDKKPDNSPQSMSNTSPQLNGNEIKPGHDNPGNNEDKYMVADELDNPADDHFDDKDILSDVNDNLPQPGDQALPKKIPSKNQDHSQTQQADSPFTDEEYKGYGTWHFVTIFLFVAGVVIVAYFLMHNRKKLREGISGYASKKGHKRQKYRPLSQQ